MRTFFIVALASLLVLSEARGFRFAVCPDRPNTGCYQSAQVTFVPGANYGYDWLWVGNTYPTYDNVAPQIGPNALADAREFAFCVWDGSNSLSSQTDYASPSSPFPLLNHLPMICHDLAVHTDTSGAVNIKLNPKFFSSLWAHRRTTTQKMNTITQLVDVETGECWGKTIAVVPTAPLPQLPSSLSAGAATVMNEINYLAALYNQALMPYDSVPLNGVEFVAAAGPALAINTMMTAQTILQPANSATFAGLLGAVHVLGSLQGAWYVRDPLAGNHPVGTAPPITAVSSQYQSVFSDVQDAFQVPPPDTASEELMDVVIDPEDPDSNIAQLYGYNTGYTLQLDSYGASLGFPTDSTTTLTCDGTHPSCTMTGINTFNCPAPTGDSLLGCNSNPVQYVTQNNNLVAAKAALSSSVTSSLLNYQNTWDPTGRSDFLKAQSSLAKNAEIFHALYSAQDALLEILEASGLSAFDWYNHSNDQVKLALGVGVLDTYNAWSTSFAYGTGLTFSGLRFDLGVTPVQS